MDGEPALGRGQADGEGLGIPREGVAAGDGADAGGAGEGGVDFETVDEGKLAELEAVGKYLIGVSVGEGGIGGVEGIGELHVEPADAASAVVVVVGGGGGSDSDDLENGEAVVTGYSSVGVHRLEELQEDSWG